MTAEAQVDRIHSKAIPDLIAKLLVERQQVLILFQRLAQMKPYNPMAPAQSLLQQFCQMLVDYVALGHFEVYQCLEQNPIDSERCRRVKLLAREIYPQLAKTTAAAIDFNDSYDCGENCQLLDNLYADLSQLGEHLATRIELEDRLISAL